MSPQSQQLPGTALTLSEDEAQAFLAWLRSQIPLVGAMQLERLALREGVLTLSAPLSVNINDKGTGFAGSLAALSTLSGWCLTTLLLRQQGLECEVMIAESQIRYLAPVTDDFCATVTLPDAEFLEPFLQRMQEKGRGKLALQVEIRADDKPLLLLEGVYFARLRSAS